MKRLMRKGTRVARGDRGRLAEVAYRWAVWGRDRGGIPVGAAVFDDGVLLGAGCNRLADGLLGVHGETDALRDAGLVSYAGAVMVSTLFPCAYCRGAIRQLGIAEVMVLDCENFETDPAPFEAMGVTFVRHDHRRSIEMFRDWLPRHRALWSRDIGAHAGKPAPPLALAPEDCRRALAIAREEAAAGARIGEIAAGAALFDREGRLLGRSPGLIRRTADPSAVPEVAAWRTCAPRRRWDDVILVATHAPGPIALGMLERFGFKNLIVGEARSYPLDLARLDRAGVRVTVLDDAGCRELLRTWRARPDAPAVERWYHG